MAAKKGSQNPTKKVVLPYKKTKGKEAVRSYNKTGNKSQKWQSNLINDIMAVNSDGLWTHVKFGYSVPRRNGKTEDLMMRMMWGLENEEKVLYTAQRTTTSHSTWEKMCALLSKSGLKEGTDYKTVKQFGLERIVMLKTEGYLNFRTRSSKGGLGEGYDLLVIDEAQEYTTDQETALKYVVTDSKNPQTIFCGTPPTAVSAGTVFVKFRDDVLSGNVQDSGWYEWSVEKQTDAYDVTAWYETNPSLGTIITERSVRAEISGDIIDFNIQRLGLWLRYNQKSAISENEWNALQVDPRKVKLKGKLFAAVKYGHDGINVALSIGVKTADKKVFLESIGCEKIRKGNDWIVKFLKETDCQKVVADGANASILEDDMKDAGIKLKLEKVTAKGIVDAGLKFEQGLEQETICHADQPSLLQSASNCDKRTIGANGGFGYKSIKEGVDVALLESAVLAYWACSSAKEKKKQKISY